MAYEGLSTWESDLISLARGMGYATYYPSFPNMAAQSEKTLAGAKEYLARFMNSPLAEGPVLTTHQMLHELLNAIHCDRGEFTRSHNEFKSFNDAMTKVRKAFGYLPPSPEAVAAYKDDEPAF